MQRNQTELFMGSNGMECQLLSFTVHKPTNPYSNFAIPWCVAASLTTWQMLLLNRGKNMIGYTSERYLLKLFLKCKRMKS